MSVLRDDEANAPSTGHEGSGEGEPGDPSAEDAYISPTEEAARLFTPGEEGAVWYAFHTRPRCEKKVAEVCRATEVRHFLPLRENVTRKGKGRYSFQVPLFPSYIFACGDDMARLSLMRTGFMVQWLEVVNQGQLLEELSGIYVACRQQTELSLYPQLKRGRRVRVVRGALSGVVGRISRRKDSFRLVLNVTLLGTAVAAEVDMDDVELI